MTPGGGAQPTANPADRVRVALLECDHVDPSLRPIAGDYGEMFVRRFAEHAPGIELDPIDVIGGAELPAPAAHDALLVTGSRHGVHDALPWIAPLAARIRTAVDAGVPVVGICFGHQLIARALGGEVARAPAGWGVGVHDTRVHRAEHWMAPPAEAVRLLMSHQDQVVTPPPGAQVLASTVHAPIAAFQAGSAVGFQGHPEFVPAYLDALMATRVDRIGRDLVEQARASLTTPTDHGLVTRWLAAALRGAR